MTQTEKHREEDLLFWLECRKFQNMSSASSVDLWKLLGVATVIFNKFLAKDAPMEVSLELCVVLCVVLGWAAL